jgi:hypothetical protein
LRSELAHATLSGHKSLLDFAHDHHGGSKAHATVLQALLFIGGKFVGAEIVDAVGVALLGNVQLGLHHHAKLEVTHVLHLGFSLF